MRIVNMRTVPLHITVILLFVGLFIGCDTDSTQPGTTGTLRLYIADAPGEFENVNIEITRVDVHRPGPNGWVPINDETRTFDLLEYSNGAMALLGEQELQAGKYTQIRLMLGDGNNVVVNGDTFSLYVPSGYQTGLKLVRQFDIEPDYTYELLIDFDVHRSIHMADGQYMLKPTVRVEPLALTGSIQGYVSPADANAVVSAIDAEPDTVVTSAYPDETGFFKLIALPSGNYNIAVEAENFENALLEGVTVEAGQTADVGTIELNEIE